MRSPFNVIEIYNSFKNEIWYCYTGVMSYEILQQLISEYYNIVMLETDIDDLVSELSMLDDHCPECGMDLNELVYDDETDTYVCKYCGEEVTEK